MALSGQQRHLMAAVSQVATGNEHKKIFDELKKRFGYLLECEIEDCILLAKQSLAHAELLKNAKDSERISNYVARWTNGQSVSE
jgi:hypothetical protein